MRRSALSENTGCGADGSGDGGAASDAPRRVGGAELPARPSAAIVRTMSTRALAALLALAAACAPRFDPRLVDAPIAGRTWVSAEERAHPLAGRIWQPSTGRFVEEAELVAAITAADFVALGEVHDNPDHHLLQARLLRAIVAAGRRPALAFEMLTTDQQPAIDAAVKAAPRDADALAREVDWAHSRWPDWKFYRPIFAAGLEAGLPIVAANLPRKQMSEIISKGRDGLDDGLKVRLAREEPLPDGTLSALREEMKESHCGELPDEMVDPMVLGQRARDARMAERMVSAGAERGAVLITGKGHARTDRGVPALVARDAPGKKVASVGFYEAQAGENDPAAYVEDGEQGALPYDFAVFTAGAAREDPCEGLRKHLDKKKRAAKPAAPAVTPAAPSETPPSAR